MDATVNTESPAPAGASSHWFSELARRRRSVYAYLEREVPRAVLQQAIADAQSAPNHHRTSPWRFHVVARSGRERLVAAYEAAARRLGRDVARAAQRARDAPVNVVVCCVPCVANPRVQVKEEEFATAAAVQNFMLSLAAAGVDSLLTTGELAESREVASLVGLDAPEARVMGLINVGYRQPERPLAPRPPVPLDQVAAWIE